MYFGATDGDGVQKDIANEDLSIHLFLLNPTCDGVDATYDLA